jgi:TRAP-type C4-dicarboxylate transport system permease small subunit
MMRCIVVPETPLFHGEQDMKKFYTIFCKLKDITAMIFLCAISGLVFISAIARTLKRPLNWAPDVSLLLFAWLVFLGADAVLRKQDFISVEILVKVFPQKVRTFLYYLWYGLALVFLGILVRYGIPLCIQNAKRLFQTLGISYSWATASVPVGSVFLIITIVIKLVQHHKGATNAVAESKF